MALSAVILALNITHKHIMQISLSTVAFFLYVKSNMTGLTGPVDPKA